SGALLCCDAIVAAVNGGGITL
ncbi:hypothetical protein A2U01_0055388, partial [Trifolium medium]|nr:hypothetical protein [Trifolium medium]